MCFFVFDFLDCIDCVANLECMLCGIKDTSRHVQKTLSEEVYMPFPPLYIYGLFFSLCKC